MTAPLIHQRVNAYTVSALPLDGSVRGWGGAFDIHVEWSGVGDLWAVRRLSAVYDADGNETWEPRPSERDDEFLARYRHDLDTAMAIARRVALQVCVNGTTALEVAASIRKEGITVTDLDPPSSAHRQTPTHRKATP